MNISIFPGESIEFPKNMWYNPCWINLNHLSVGKLRFQADPNLCFIKVDRNHPNHFTQGRFIANSKLRMNKQQLTPLILRHMVIFCSQNGSSKSRNRSFHHLTWSLYFIYCSIIFGWPLLAIYKEIVGDSVDWAFPDFALAGRIEGVSDLNVDAPLPVYWKVGWKRLQKKSKDLLKVFNFREYTDYIYVYTHVFSCKYYMYIYIYIINAIQCARLISGVQQVWATKDMLLLSEQNSRNMDAYLQYKAPSCTYQTWYHTHVYSSYDIHISMKANIYMHLFHRIRHT